MSINSNCDSIAKRLTWRFFAALQTIFTNAFYGFVYITDHSSEVLHHNFTICPSTGYMRGHTPRGVHRIFQKGLFGWISAHLKGARNSSDYWEKNMSFLGAYSPGKFLGFQLPEIKSGSNFKGISVWNHNRTSNRYSKTEISLTIKILKIWSPRDQIW